MVSGGCMCGDVQFVTKGALDDILVCHCGQCRAQAGNYYWATNLPAKNLCFQQDITLEWYRSSPTAEHGFCRDCEAVLFWRSMTSYRKDIQASKNISVLMGTFDQRLPLKIAEHTYQQEASGAYPLLAGENNA